jgi:ubiquinol-cytochrome c reductase cytochrome b subunit
VTPLRDWLDARTGYRAGLRHLLHEELPAGVGWWFVTGSVVLFLLVLQLVTGVALAVYYVPAPEFAYDSVRFIMDRVTFGPVLRGLHVFGASFIVVAACVHMLRVVALGSYKKPREVTWITGVVLLLIIMVFALTGYLLPWDQKAYWGTTVTINIARSMPVAGDFFARLLRGGADLGALTLVRWYAMHVFLLPAAVVGFTLAHLFLMRRHRISGPVSPGAGEPRAFYPHHALKDTFAVAVVFSGLLLLATLRTPDLGPVADPSDAAYVPRPEWYFLWLFQLLKYFPGRMEVIATIAIPALIVGGLLFLPFFDRRPERQLLRRPAVAASFAVLVLGIWILTYLGVKDSPADAPSSHGGLIALAGEQFAEDPRCQQCHRPGGAATAVGDIRPRRDPEWLAGHLADPEVIAPGLRPPPKGGLDDRQIRAILSYVRTLRGGSASADTDPDSRLAALVFARSCSFCHRIDGAGEAVGPDLTHIGSKRDAKWLREWISDPSRLDVVASMPGFSERLSEREITAISGYLSRRK